MIAKLRRLSRQFAVRIVATMLLVSVPLLVLLAALLTSQASANLGQAGQQSGEALARAVALRLEDWLKESRQSVHVLAETVPADTPDATSLAASLAAVTANFQGYSVLEFADTSGKIVASSNPAAELPVARQSWYTEALSGKTVFTSLMQRGSHIDWILAEPVLAADHTVRGVVVADLDPIVLTTLLDPELKAGWGVIVVDDAHRLVYDTETMQSAKDDAALLAAGALQERVDNAATRQAFATNQSGGSSFLDQPGTAEFTDLHGNKAFGGYDIVDDVNWMLIAHTEARGPIGPGHSGARMTRSCCASGER